MAKDKSKKDKKADTKGTAAKADKAEKKEKAPEFKYGVADLAEKLGIKEASVRVQLRNRSIPKGGKSYGWNTKGELDEVAAQLKTKEESTKADKKSSKKSKEEPAAEVKGDKKKGKKDKKNKE